ncbi:MAG: hypothetical protein JXR68_03465 [Bacteroidales bacterium]|nr:hypothetical protein [Bacteroidales bacterium]
MIKLIIFIFIPLLANSQNVTIIDNYSKFAMPGVRVYCSNSPDTLQSNSSGIVNIDILSNDETIIFSYPMFKKSGYTKSELAKLHNIIYLDRSQSLMQQNTSNLAVKEYSGDLPFFTDIVNLDDASIFDAGTNSADDNLSMRIDEGGFSILQGLEVNNVLLSIDGIRLNDEIHKNGKVEGLLNFNNTMTQSVRKIYGTGFTIYSPHAIGGIINYFTKYPAVSSDYSVHAKIELNSKYQSVSNSFLNNVNVNFITRNFTSFTSFSYGKFGDITMGKNRDYLSTSDSVYGLNNYYIEHTTLGDTIKKNTNPYKQLGTKYEQIYFLQKFRYRLDDFANVLFNFHYINTSEVGIYSGLTEINIDHLRFAECQFGPQDKLIGNINFIYDRKTKLFDLFSINTTYIRYNEYRLTRKYKNPVALHQIEDLSVVKITSDFVKIKNTSRIAYGISFDYNQLNSTAYFNDINTDSVWQGMTRYPTDGSFSQNGALYFNFKSMNKPNFFYNLGIRTDLRYTHSDFNNISPQLPLPFTEINRTEFAPVASANIETTPFTWLYMNFVISASKQLPIIADFGRIMVKDYIVNIPTNNLKSEKDYSAKFGTTIFASEELKIYGSALFTLANNAIISTATTLNGNDSLFFGTDKYKIATKTNIKLAYIYGGSLGFNYTHYFREAEDILIKINSSVNYVEGINLSNNLPLPNIYPYFGNANIALKIHNLELNLTTIFNGAKSLDELSPVGEDYIEKAASTGFLAWQIYNTKITYKKENKFELSCSIDNIFDKFYRHYKSAIAAPGRNFVFSAKIVIN